MKNQRLLGRLGAACLLVSSVAVGASAQGRPYPHYPVPRQSAPVHRGPAAYAPPAASATPGVRFGIKGGLNVADWSGTSVSSALGINSLSSGTITHEMRPSFHGGFYVTLPVAPGFAIEPAVLYSEKGTVLSAGTPSALDLLSPSVKATARLGYIDVPVVAKVFLSQGFYLYAGPQASFLVRGTARTKVGALGITALQQDFDIKNQLRNVDFAVVGGLGYQFDSGFGLSAGYDYGLTSLDAGNRFDAQNRVIKASVNYSF